MGVWHSGQPSQRGSACWPQGRPALGKEGRDSHPGHSAASPPPPPRWAPLLQALPRPPPSGGMFASLLLVKRPSNAHRDAQRQPAATADMCGARLLRAWRLPETDDGTGAEPKTRHVPEVFSKNIINVQNCNLTGAPLLAKISDSRPRQPRTLNVGLETLAVRDGARARRVALPPSPAPSPSPLPSRAGQIITFWISCASPSPKCTSPWA